MSEEGKRKKRDKDKADLAKGLTLAQDSMKSAKGKEDVDESFTSSLRASLRYGQKGQKSAGEKWDWAEKKT